MEEIDLTPDFKSMFRNMLAEAKRMGDPKGWFDDLGDQERAYALRDVQRWFWPLVVAAATMTTQEDVVALRTLLAEMLRNINTVAGEVENEIASDVDDTPNGTFPEGDDDVNERLGAGRGGE